jgi:zinc D-Ala-D-Ala carboxypeptidase
MNSLSTRLSPNFTLGELLRSNVAERDLSLKSEQENPPQSVVDSLGYLANMVLQPVRDGLGYPVRINSGYRSHVVNKLVGGSARSQHCVGEAADCELSPSFH